MVNELLLDPFIWLEIVEMQIEFILKLLLLLLFLLLFLLLLLLLLLSLYSTLIKLYKVKYKNQAQLQKADLLQRI